MGNKFDFYEIVKVSSTKPSLSEINECEGVVLGMSENEETGQWGYAVSIYDDEGFCWDVLEGDLFSTGKKANPNDFKTGESVKVSVDRKTGKGKLINDDDD